MNIEEIKARAEAAAVHEYDGITDLIYGRDVKALIAEMEQLTGMYSDAEETNEKLICRAEKAESEVERLTDQHQCDVHNIAAMQTTLNQQAKNCEKLLSDDKQHITALENDKINADMNLENLTAEVEGLNTINATLKKALGLACNCIEKQERESGSEYISEEIKDYFMKQVQQTHETQEAEK
jgi:hypothetical protein